MSAWRVALKELAELGGTADGAMFGDCFGRQELSRMGLATWRYTGKTEIEWTLTAQGRDAAEGRLTQVEVRPGGRRWVATWLMSLPRGS